MEFRKIFDTIPEQFDKFRPRSSPLYPLELYAAREIGMNALQGTWFHHLAFEPHIPLSYSR